MTRRTSPDYRSCFYEGTLEHRRLRPVPHRFNAQIFLVLLDLAEVPRLFAEQPLGPRWLWSDRWPALARFRRADYLGDQRRDLAECVRDEVEQQLGTRPRGAVQLLTNFRYLGWRMNPVSFYYCYDEHDHLAALVAEVRNTPWKERHVYVLDGRAPRANEVSPRGHEDPPRSKLVQRELAKAFHVSPFMGMEQQYHWRIEPPGESLRLQIESREDHAPIFAAGLQLQRRALSCETGLRLLAEYPLQTWRIGLMIYWQAFRLWQKQVPFYPHPEARPAPKQA